MQQNQIVINGRPDDLHVHFRRGPMLKEVMPVTAKYFARALVMPNTPGDGILNADDLTKHRAEIQEEQMINQDSRVRDFTPLMTIKLVGKNSQGVPITTPDTIREAHRAGAVAAKAYPVQDPGATKEPVKELTYGKLFPGKIEVVTTNAEVGVSNFTEMDDVLEAMQEVGMVLCVHGERPGKFCMDREREFLIDVERLALGYPRLRIVLEHVTTEAAVEMVKCHGSNLSATITAHHLVLTLDDVIGGMFSPHNFCKPIAKTEADRAALVKAAVSGNPKFFFGSDSAPHLQGKKECGAGAAGCFTAEVALPLLAGVFDCAGHPDRLEAFVSRAGARAYGLPVNSGQVDLVREQWVVGPDPDASVVSFALGATLQWKVKYVF
jgi:dihydroorotase